MKYLVIDYTQFDEWSSEEEVTFNTGIEKGYENWVHIESDEDEPIVEKGLDKVDEADYAIPILDPEQLSDDDNKNDVQSSFLVKKEEAGMYILHWVLSRKNIFSNFRILCKIFYFIFL